MKKPVKLLILLLILAVLALAYLGLNSASSDDSDASVSVTEEGSMTVFAAETDAITALSWTLDGETYSLVKDEEDETWSCEEDYPLDADEVEDLVEAASSILAERTVDISDSELSDFELDDPAMIVTISTSSVDTTVLLGMRNPYTDQNYAMIEGSDTVYLLDTDLYSAFELTLLDLVETESLEDYSTSRTLTIETDSGTLVLLHPEDNEGLAYSDDFTWFVQDEDGNYTALDATNTASLAAYITNMSWADVVAYEPADLSDYGLDSPLATVTIDYETDDETEATAVLLIGAVSEYEEIEETEEEESSDDDFDSAAADSSLSELIGDLGLDEDDGDAAEDEESDTDDTETAAEEETEAEALYYYAMLEGGEMVYTLKASTVEKILSASVDSLLPEDLCLIDWDTLTAMTFTIDGEQYQFLIRRVETEDEDGNITESVVCTLNGTEVDEDDVEDILDLITDLEVETTITAEEANTAESEDTAAGTDEEDTGDTESTEEEDTADITIRFSRDRDTWSVMTMTLTEYDLNFYQVSFNDRSDQLVSIRDVAELIDAVVNFGVEEDLTSLTTE